MDAGDPDVTVFTSNAAPIVPRTHSTDITAHKRCYCAPAAHSSTLMRDPLSATWTSSPGWDVGMTVPEIRREEIRRLCWSALALAAAHTAHCAAFNREPLDLFLIQPENVSDALLDAWTYLIPLHSTLFFSQEKRVVLGTGTLHSHRSNLSGRCTAAACCCGIVVYDFGKARRAMARRRSLRCKHGWRLKKSRIQWMLIYAQLIHICCT